MIGYIRQPSDWKTEKQVQVLSYDLPLMCGQGETGTATVTGLTGNYRRYLFSLEGRDDVWVISGVSSTENGITTLQLEDSTAVCEDYCLGGFDSVISAWDLFPAGLEVTAVYSGYNRYKISDWQSKDRFQPFYRSIRYLNGKDAFDYTVPELDSDNHWTANCGMKREVDRLLANIDVTNALEQIGSTGYYRVNLREMLRDLQASSLKVRIKVVPYIYEACTVYPAEGDGIRYGEHVYRIGSNTVSTGVSTQVVCTLDESAPVFFETDRAPEFRNGSYLFYTHYCRMTVRKDRTRAADEEKCELQLDISEGEPYDTAVPVFFNDGHSEVLSETYDEKEVLSRVILFPNNGGSPRSFYLTDSGTVSVSSSEQTQGATAFVQTDLASISTEAGTALAGTEFAKNASSHRIEFASDKEFRMGQPVKLMLERGILDTVISKVSITSGDDRYRYVCGTIPSTVSDRLQTYKWSYGSRTPVSAKRGSLFIKA